MQKLDETSEGGESPLFHTSNTQLGGLRGQPRPRAINLTSDARVPSVCPSSCHNLLNLISHAGSYRSGNIFSCVSDLGDLRH